MTKTLTYPAFAVAGLIVILIFVTAKTYSQLAAAIVLYPAFIFLTFMLFPRKGPQSPKTSMHSPQKLPKSKPETYSTPPESVHIADVDKRTFIKLIGATGVSFFLFSLLGKRFESFLFGRNAQSAINSITSGDQFGTASTSPTDGYKISEIDEGSVSYFGFINKNGAWLVMKEDENGSTFRYAKGSSDFPSNWTNRESLRYDYFYNLF